MAKDTRFGASTGRAAPPPFGITSRPAWNATPDALALLSGHLLPGDLLLFWADRSVQGKAIRIAQSLLGVPPKACQIVHVAIYAGGGQVIHATFSLLDSDVAQVRMQPVADACLGRKLSVVSPLPRDQTASTDRANVVAAAQKMLKQRYSVGLIVDAAFLAILPAAFRNWIDRRSARHLASGQICSTFVFDAFLTALRDRNPFDLGEEGWIAPFTLPALFFWHPGLADVLPTPPRQVFQPPPQPG